MKGHFAITLFPSRRPRVPVALHLAPHLTHRVLADRASEQSAERAAHTARVGAGQVAAGDQRVGGQRAALVGPQRLALPLGGLAVGSLEPRARTAISIGPKLPVSDRSRLPCR
jgi:hypothetical protein